MCDGSGLKKSVGDISLDGNWTQVCDLATSSILPMLPHPISGEHEKEIALFFLEQKARIGKNLHQILALLKNFKKSKAAMRKHIIPLFLLLGEQEDGNQLWSSSSNEEKCSLIISELYRIFDMEISEDGPLSPFFLRDFESIANPIKTTFAYILKSFRNTLGLKDGEWKSYPAAQHAFQWLIFQVKYPYLTDHVDGCIIPSLNFFDDFETENILFGIACLSHIFDNVLGSEVRHSGWGTLVHGHLKKSLSFQKQAQIVDKIMPELLKILKIIEVDPHLHSDQFTLYDTTLDSMLTALETTDSVNKCVWLKHLTTYFEVMGLATLHWIDRIIRMLLDNTVCIEPLRWLYVLKCTRVCIFNTWVKPHSESFAEIILRNLFNITTLKILIASEEKQTVVEIQEVAIECLQALWHNEDVEAVKPQLLNLHINGKGKLLPKFLVAMEELFAQTTGNPPQAQG